MALFSPATWRALGLTVGVAYTGFGIVETLLPAQAAREFFGIQPRAKAEVDDAVSVMVPLMGARDFSLSAAMLTFWYYGKDWELGVVILAGSILCVADSIAIFNRRGFAA
ncbi:hypothetical protein UCRPA7_2105 [Phaeoacremonium minimum UCRPA7]|uniref:DUF2127 domain-containing protein n=1 Tax=Phaeoacremonium minimum (strain UCR-PA7) TaxID=1286976 RepID=R8BSW3_PHAM7|nr:hypothetical protein UCRPA7_2105 [Phaeoacremonium minimum UCRPA7]EOO02360.1 hypothetical protein UCRPA7_2105 [Phaeoacremonium minimum UCRPA7]